MFGGLVGRQRGRVVDRFRTRKAADLLAYIAFYRQSAHSRDALIEILWPDSEPDAGRHNLRQALTSLRRQFEPPGTPPGSVFIADRSVVRVDPSALTTDVADFEELLRSMTSSPPSEYEADNLAAADHLYRGDLLAGSYSDWVILERDRLAEAHRGALLQLSLIYENGGAMARGLDCALRLVAVDPFSEAAHCAAIRLFAAQGRQDEAIKQSQTLERILWEEMREQPSEETRRLIGSLGADRGAASALSLPPRPSIRVRKSGMTPQAEPASNLPLSFTRFFGRRPEIDALSRYLLEDRSRLVTLTGPGGCGKSRLSLEVGRQLAASFSGNVAFVPLAEIEDHALIPAEVLDALQIQRLPLLDPLQQVCKALCQRRFLLILDNFEQLVEEGANTVRSLLNAAPELVCLVTSRRPLEIDGEQTYPLSPLPVPDQPATPSRLMEFAGIELFVDRAQRVVPDFQLTTRTAGDVAAVCRKLEGLPLALELAAARVHIISPASMLAQLEDRFSFLTSRRKDLPERHRTLYAAIDWSYRLLSPTLQRFFTSLSVFRGGFNLSAASAVCGRDFILEQLQQVYEQSLVVALEASDGVRYALLDSLREYATDQLDATEAAPLRLAHATYYARLVDRCTEGIKGPARMECLKLLELEHENIRAAIIWTLSQQNDLALTLCAGMAPFWLARNHVSEGRDWLDRAMIECVGSTADRAHALSGAASLAAHAWDLSAATSFASNSLSLYREIGNRAGEAIALLMLGLAAHDGNEHNAAYQYLEQGMACAETTGDRWLIAHSLLTAGRAKMQHGDKGAAVLLLRRSLAMFRDAGDKAPIADTLRVLAHTIQGPEDYGTALIMLEEARDLFEELEDTAGVAYCLLSMGHIARFQERRSQARVFYNNGLSLCEMAGDAFGQAHAALNLGHLERHDGAYASSRIRYFEALKLFLSLRHERGIAFSLEGLAGLYAAQGLCLKAARTRGAADKLRETAGLPLPELDRQMYEHYIQSARKSLGEAAFTCAWRAGSEVPLDEAIQDAMILEE